MTGSDWQCNLTFAQTNVRAANVSVAGSEQREPLDLGFVSDAWWPLVTGLKTRSTASQVDRRLLELCVVTRVANDLKSGDLYIPEGDKFRDYRLQLLSWEEVERELANYGEQPGIATEPKLFIAQLRKQLEERGRAADKSFPANRYLRFENGETILTPVEAALDPEGLDRVLSLIVGSPFPAPLSPLAASFLRCAPDRFLLTKPNTSCTIELPASLRSDGVRDHPGMPFGLIPDPAFGFAGIPK